MTDVLMPCGVHVEAPSDVEEIDAVFVHAHRSAHGTIERWKNKETFCAIRDSCAKGFQWLEAQAWNIWAMNFIDRAYGESLDVIGRIVGEGRNDQPDENYRIRIKARILINASEGKAGDIAAVIAALDPATFRIFDAPPASFSVYLYEPITGPVTHDELARLIGEAKAGGYGASVTMPMPGAGLFWGDTTDPLRKFSALAHNSGNILGAGTLAIPYTTTPAAGARLFLHVADESGEDLPTPSGWTLLSNYMLNSSGAARQKLWTKLAVGTESGTIGLAKAGGSRAIGRIYEVRAPSLTIDESSFSESAGTGTLINGPDLPGGPMWGLAFIAYDSGGTITPITLAGNHWDEVAAEAVAGSAPGGIGLSAQVVSSASGVTDAFMATLSDTADWAVIGFKIGPRVEAGLGFGLMADRRKASI